MVLLWAGFLLLLAGLLFVDLKVLNRGHEVISASKAIRQWAAWVGVAMVCTVGLRYVYDLVLIPRGLVAADPSDMLMPSSGWHAAVMCLQAYLVEQVLSMDNMLVIAMLMAYFKVPAAYQHRVLFWGIIGAVVLRGSMIIAGATLVQRFEWVMIVFGVMLLATAVKLIATKEGGEGDLDKNLVVRVSRAVLPVSKEYDGAKFFTKLDGRWLATPMFLALLVVDLADAVFAVDSIPATMAFTHDTFVAFTANCLAVLGLRALYFAVAAMIAKFVYLKPCLVLLLGFIGIKMVIHRWAPIPELASLAVVVGVLAAGVVASVLAKPRAKVEPVDKGK